MNIILSYEKSIPLKKEDIKKTEVNWSKSMSYISIIILAGDTKIKLKDSFCENLTELALFIKENYDDVTDVKITF